MNQKKINISATFSCFILLTLFCLFVPNKTVSYSAKAAGKITVNYPTDDLVMPDMPEQTEGETVVVDGMLLFPKNSTNFNSNVSVGEHYRYLDNTEKILYRGMVAAASHVYDYGTSYNDYEEEGMIPLAIGETTRFSYSQDQYQNAYEAARSDHPDMMQFNLCKVYTSSYSTYYSSMGTYTYSTYLFMVSNNSAYDQSSFDRMTAQIRSKRTEILSDVSIAGAQGALEKELAIHDKLLEMIVYDKACAQASSAYHISHTAYGALLNGTCVCDGYSLAFSYLLDGVGINSMVVSGRAGEEATGNHAWNIVKLDGSWYEVDCTWDDYVPQQVLPDEFVTEVQHLYYHLTTSQISNYEYLVRAAGYSTNGIRKRERDRYSLGCPVATGTQYSYHNILDAIDGNEDLTVIPLTAISISPEAIDYSIGSEGDFTAVLEPADAAGMDIIWLSSDDNVITVDENGHYKIVGSGVATVMACSENGRVKSNKCKVIVKDGNGNTPVGGITLSPGKATKALGDTGMISFDFYPSNASNRNVTWKSTNERVATLTLVEGQGLQYTVTGTGKTMITVTTVDGEYEGFCYIDVPVQYCKVSFDLNGAAGSIADKTVTVGDIYWMLPDVTRDGYDFTGWYTQPVDGTRVTAYTTVSNTGDHTLYAHWKIRQSVTYGGNQTSQNNTENNQNDAAGNTGNDNNTGAGHGGNAGNGQNTPSGNSGATGNSRNDVTGGSGNTDNDQGSASGDFRASEPSTGKEAGTDNGSQRDVAGNSTTSESGSEEYNEDAEGDEDTEDSAGLDDVIISEGGTSYELSESGEATAQNADNKKITKLIIKDTVTYNGCLFKVTEIQDDAYKNCKSLKNLTIGANVQRIGAGAFRNCKNLSKITIKAGNLQTIGSNSFKGIKKKATITIVCKDKKTYNRWVKKIKKAGAKSAKFKFKKG